MQAAFIRDAAMTAVVFGFFASSWFGWAQEAPPASWRRWLGAGVHLFPVADIIDYPVVHAAGALVTVAAVAAVPWARARSLRPSAAVGPPAGAALLAVALYSLITALSPT